MELKKVTIKNFRSIKQMELDFDPSCKILIGVNESGKSNILCALSLLSNNIEPAPSDEREPLSGEDPIDESNVTFVFTLNSSDIKKISELIKVNSLCTCNHISFKFNKRYLSIKEFIENQVHFIVDIKEKTKQIVHMPHKYGENIISGWKKPSPSAPQTIVLTNGQVVELKEKFLIHEQDFNEKIIDNKETGPTKLRDEISKEFLQDITIDEFLNILDVQIEDLLTEQFPECIFWEYSEEYLLPSKVNLINFSNDPNICVPLKHMFQLAKVSDISKAFIDARARHNHSVNNLLTHVAKESTKHFQNIWKEYNGIQFHLQENGVNIDIGIKESENLFECNMRSDGFKRFITFLLMVSSRVKNNSMRDSLLIIDDPDIGLHPSASRCLRDELLEIAKTNIVVYATHSIFMIDKENISRHILVKKKNELTSITEAKESNIFDEEVLYNALGYSLFEELKEKNILFEGWQDKHLFLTALNKLPSNHQKLKGAFNKIGIAHSRGVSFMKNITQVFELVNRKFLIISDNDEPAKSAQKEFNDEKFNGTWKRYNELIQGTPEITAEDFIKCDTIINIIDNLRKDYIELPDIRKGDISYPGGTIGSLKRWLRNSKYDGEKQAEILRKIKENIFYNLEPSQIEENYYLLMEKILDNI